MIPTNPKTAKEADCAYLPKTGTDVRFAMAMIDTSEEGLRRSEYVNDKLITVGYEELAERSQTENTGIGQKKITRKLLTTLRATAREFATTQQQRFVLRVALERNYGGGQGLFGLSAVYRHWLEHGVMCAAGIAIPGMEHLIKFDVICRPDLIPGRHSSY